MPRLILILLLAGGAVGAEPGEVLNALGSDRLSIQYFQLPIVVRLAELEIPPETAERAEAMLAAVVGKRATIAWQADLGADEAGTPRVYVTVGADPEPLNEALVRAGLARFAPLGTGGRARDRLAAAQDKAKKAKAGLWAAGTEAAVAAVPSQAPAAPRAGGPFCAEVDGRIFYPSDSPEAARLNPRRVVFYASEAAARKAGKSAARPSAAPAVNGLDGARAALAHGKSLIEQAAGAPPDEKRDALYERAFLELSAAMQVMTPLAEAHPDDERLGADLHACMELRYAAMKSRRLH